MTRFRSCFAGCD